MIYFDNAATSWPKPPGVAEAIVRYLNDVGANPGRSGHRLSIKAARIVSDVREALACLFGADDPLRIVFTHNVTHALNTARQRIWIATPYFIPDKATMSALRLALLKGLDVRILTPALNDNWFVRNADGNWYPEY